MTDQSIRTLFQSAEAKREAIETSWDSSSLTYKENLAAAIATFEECRLLADRLSLFSPNETLEDIATGDLQYLLINHRLGNLYGKVFSSPSRASKLHASRTAYDRFLSLLSHYEILSPSERKHYAQYSESPTTFSTISTSHAEARRAAKIANYHQEKELKQKLDFLSQNPTYLEHNADDDDDAVRSVHLATIHLCTHHTFQSLESLNLELAILALAPPPLTDPTSSQPHAAGKDDRERERERQNGQHSSNIHSSSSDRLDLPHNNSSGPILSQAGKPLRPFTLLDGSASSQRQRLASGVFQPGHNLPTMTIDEYLAEEKRRGGIIEGGGEASGVRPEVDEDDYERADRETEKAREWDEFVEANPKGAGNRMNRG